jgi:transcriptional regulator with XRE-family HTH domain
MEFSEKLREELDYKGWTVKELAATTGVSVNTLSHYLNGNKSIPSADVAIRIAKALNVTVEFLFDSEETPMSQKIVPLKIRRIAEKVLRLDEFDRSAVETLIEKMATRYE